MVANPQIIFKEEHKTFVYFIAVLLLSLIPAFQCSGQKSEVPLCKIDVNKKYQTIENFGASDCWTVQFVGKWPDAKRNAMADLLFSEKMDTTGKPLGIGLSLWRFNIGGGSAEQGDSSLISTDWRRAECFLNADQSYNWSKQAGQQWFLKAAKERGVKQFLGFAITAPVFMTQNGLAFNKLRDETFNLQPDKYEAFADFLARVIQGIRQNTGIELNYISPFNEPEWDWRGNSQEGTPALNSEITKTVRLLDKKLTHYQLNTKIVVTESGQLDYMYKTGTNKPGRDNQIEEFFNPQSPNYIGNLTHVPHLIAGHAYWTLNPVSDMIGKRAALHKAIAERNLSYWQTEVCLMEQIPNVGDGHGMDLSMKTALFFARLIHHDMVTSNASAWHWWLSISNSDYKDGLIYVFPDKEKTDGTYTDSKLLWALGNYSRFVRPGAIRVDASGSDINDPDGLMISAYQDNQRKQLVVVAVNYSGHAKKFRLDIPGVSIEKAIPYITSDVPGENLSPGKPLKMKDEISVSSRSIMTIVCTSK